MPTCAEVCPLEISKCSEDSVGLVADAELICRAIYEPSAFKSGKVRAALIDKKALADGELSVWRAMGSTQWQLSDVISQLRGMPSPGRKLIGIIGVNAAEIRSASTCRRICVLDETACDRSGGRHSHHAHITPCRRTQPFPMDATSDELRELQLIVWGLYQKSAAVEYAAA